MKTMNLPMNDEQWNELHVIKKGSSLMSVISIAEGDSLREIELRGSITLRELVEASEYPVAICMMAVGSLIRRQLVHCERDEQHIRLHPTIQAKAD